jgi:hypothetical protein
MGQAPGHTGLDSVVRRSIGLVRRWPVQALPPLGMRNVWWPLLAPECHQTGDHEDQIDLPEMSLCLAAPTAIGRACEVSSSPPPGLPFAPRDDERLSRRQVFMPLPLHTPAFPSPIFHSCRSRCVSYGGQTVRYPAHRSCPYDVCDPGCPCGLTAHSTLRAATGACGLFRCLSAVVLCRPAHELRWALPPCRRPRHPGETRRNRPDVPTGPPLCAARPARPTLGAHDGPGSHG